MNKGWRNLLIIGIVALVATIAWDIYQSSEGGRADFNPFINKLETTVLFPANLEDHIRAGTANLVDVDSSQVEE